MIFCMLCLDQDLKNGRKTAPLAGKSPTVFKNHRKCDNLIGCQSFWKEIFFFFGSLKRRQNPYQDCFYLGVCAIVSDVIVCVAATDNISPDNQCSKALIASDRFTETHKQGKKIEEKWECVTSVMWKIFKFRSIKNRSLKEKKIKIFFTGFFMRMSKNKH